MKRIYEIYNDINSKVYIGKTGKELKVRMRQHIGERKKQRSKWKPLYADMERIGTDSFHIREIECVEDSRADEREQYWIKTMTDNGRSYNIAIGGKGRPKYNRQEMIEVINRGEKSTKEISRDVGCSTDMVRIVAKENNIFLEDGRKNGQDYKSVSIIKERKGEEQEQLFHSYEDAVRWCKRVGVSSGKYPSLIASHIRQCCKGERKSAYGYVWKFAK